MKNEEDFNSDTWYKSNYNRVNATAVQGSLSNRILHKLIEKPFKSNLNFKILEVGGNTGEHLPFVRSDFASYLISDIRPIDIKSRLTKLLNEIGRNDRGYVDFQLEDVQKLSFENNTFDRVISTCLFHHLDNPIDAFREVRRVTKIGGVISILIPHDPGILYRILRMCTTLRVAKKLGLYKEAQFIHAIEHRNHYLQLKIILESVFHDDKISPDYFPFKLKGYNFNAITVFHIRKIS